MSMRFLNIISGLYKHSSLS